MLAFINLNLQIGKENMTVSQKTVEQIIGRLITDADFRERAARDLDIVCVEEGYDLTEAERSIVGSLDFMQLSQTGEYWLDDRIKRFAPIKKRVKQEQEDRA